MRRGRAVPAKGSPLVAGTAKIDPARIPVKDLVNQIIDALIRRALAGKLSQSSFEDVFVKVRGALPKGGVSPTDPPSYYKLFGFKNYGRKVLANAPLRNVSFKRILNIRDALVELHIKSAIVLKETDRSHISTWINLLQDLLLKIEPPQSSHDQPHGTGEASAAGYDPTDYGIAKSFADLTKPFFDHYLLSEFGAVPFGGRETELAQLNKWLENEQAAPRMVLAAPAGSGKTALVLHWLKSIRAGAGDAAEWQTAFVPISIRGNSNRPETFYACLAHRLAELLNEAPALAHRGFAAFKAEALGAGELGGQKFLETLYHADQVSDAVAEFKRVIRAQLQRIAQSGNRVVIVIDGLDEALHGEFDSSIFPPILPVHIRVLLSARLQTGDIDSNGWLQRLRWDHDVRVEPNPQLKPLHSEQIAEVLATIGTPLDQLIQNKAMMKRLAGLTLGEPILIRFYCDDMRRIAATGISITLPVLEKMKPGFEGYFAYWITELARTWRDEGNRVDENDLWAALAVLAFAYGPLSGREFLEIYAAIHNKSNIIAESYLLDPLRRFIMGNGTPEHGYVLNHPKVGEYLQSEKFRGRAEHIQRTFLSWVQQYLRALNSTSASNEPSRYVLQFLRYHFEGFGVSPLEWMELVNDGWRRAWLYLDEGPRGFAGDVQAAWNAVRRLGPLVELGAQWRCALTLSSIRSVGENLGMNGSAPLLIAATRASVISKSQAAYFAKLGRDTRYHIGVMLQLALKIDDNALAEDLLSAGTQRALLYNHHEERAEALISLAPHRPPDQRARILEAAHEAAEVIEDHKSRVSVLAQLAQLLSGRQRSDVCDEAFAVATSIENQYHRAVAFASMIPIAPPDQRVRLLEEIGAAAARATRYWDYINFKDTLPLIAALSPNERRPVLRNILDRTEFMHHEQFAVESLASLLPLSESEQRDEILCAAMSVVQRMDDDSSRSQALTSLLSHLTFGPPSEILEQLICLARAIRDPGYRAQAIGLLVPHVPPQQRAHLVHEGFDAGAALARGGLFMRNYRLEPILPYLSAAQIKELIGDVIIIADEWYQADALARVAACLHLPLREKIVDDALRVASRISDPWNRARVRVQIAALLPEDSKDDLYHQVTKDAMADDDWSRHDATIVPLVHNLPPKHRSVVISHALSAVKRIPNEFSRIKALGDLTTLVPIGQRTELVDEVLAMAETIPVGASKIMALVSIMPFLSVEQRTDLVKGTFDDAKAIIDKRDRIESLALILPYLGPSQRAEMYSEMLALALEIQEPRTRAQALGSLAAPATPQERTALLERILDAVVAISPHWYRCGALTEFAPYAMPHQYAKVIDCALVSAAHCPRNYVMAVIGASAHITVALGGTQAVEALYGAIMDTASWYP
jgi:AAA ATPase domain